MARRLLANPAPTVAMISKYRACVLLCLGWSLTAGCGDVASDLIEASPDPSSTTLPASTMGAAASSSGNPACTSNADCSGEFDICHPERLRCVECVTDGHCDELGETCSAQLGECAVPCTTASDCGSDDPICDSAIGFCVECLGDADCTAGELCRSSECQRP